MYRAAALALCLTATVSPAAGGDGTACQLGLRVQAVAAAIRNPEVEGAIRTITGLGTDSRYYTMVRGWLVQQLKGDRSIVAASGSGRVPRIEERIRFLEEAIRAIDLE